MLPSPIDFGAPEKFTTWRHYQPAAMWDPDGAPTRHVLSVLPTGSGKSLIYVMRALTNGWRAVFLTSTKALQDQLAADFRSVGLVDARGANAFPCVELGPGGKFADIWRPKGARDTCDEAPCRSGARCGRQAGPHQTQHGCEYYDMVEAAKGGQLIVTNYHYWMSMRAFTQHGLCRMRQIGEGREKHWVREKDFDLLVLDEAHNAPDELCGFLEQEFSPWELSVLRAEPFEGTAEVDQWQQWIAWQYQVAKTASFKARVEVQDIEEFGGEPSGRLLREARVWAGLERKLEMVQGFDETWAVSVDATKRLKFAPTMPATYAEQWLFSRVPRVLMVSATVRPKTAEYLGVGAGDLTMFEYPTVFPRARCPIWFVPIAFMKHSMGASEKAAMYRAVDTVIGSRRDRKGIVHTVSYGRAREMAKESKYKDWVITHGPGEAAEAIARFKRAKAPAVLMSPSVATGVDFPYDECRYVVIPKVPFPDLRDPIQKARAHHDPDYAPYITMQVLVQGAGRGMRAEDDACETIILDSMYGWVGKKYGHLAPPWFSEAVERSATLPPPLRW